MFTKYVIINPWISSYKISCFLTKFDLILICTYKRNLFKLKLVFTREICILMDGYDSFRDKLFEITQSNEILNKYFSTLDVKRSHFFHADLKKVIPVYLDKYFLSYDHFYLKKVPFLSTYENNIRFSKKQDILQELIHWKWVLYMW